MQAVREDIHIPYAKAEVVRQMQVRVMGRNTQECTSFVTGD